LQPNITLINLFTNDIKRRNNNRATNNLIILSMGSGIKLTNHPETGESRLFAVDSSGNSKRLEIVTFDTEFDTTSRVISNKMNKTATTCAVASSKDDHVNRRERSCKSHQTVRRATTTVRKKTIVSRLFRKPILLNNSTIYIITILSFLLLKNDQLFPFVDGAQVAEEGVEEVVEAPCLLAKMGTMGIVIGLVICAAIGIPCVMHCMWEQEKAAAEDAAKKQAKSMSGSIQRSMDGRGSEITKDDIEDAELKEKDPKKWREKHQIMGLDPSTFMIVVGVMIIMMCMACMAQNGKQQQYCDENWDDDDWW